MNPGLFLDKYTNDLHIFVNSTDSAGRIILETLTVSDLPLGQTIAIGLVSNGKSLEVYVNCRLYTTLLYAGKPYLPKTNNVWYGRYCAFPFLGSVQNLTLWDAPLMTQDVIRICRTSPITDAPSTCAAAAVNALSSVNTNALTSINTNSLVSTSISKLTNP